MSGLKVLGYYKFTFLNNAARAMHFPVPAIILQRLHVYQIFSMKKILHVSSRLTIYFAPNMKSKAVVLLCIFL